MSLLAYNITGAPLTLVGITPPLVLPASSSPPERGLPVNVTSHFAVLSAAQLIALAAQQVGKFDLFWTSEAEYQLNHVVATTIIDSVVTGNVFIYRPGSTPTVPNTFATFEAAYAAATKLDSPATIYIDDRLQNAQLRTAGNYDLRQITLSGLGMQNSNSFYIYDGVTFNEGIHRITGNLQVYTEFSNPSSVLISPRLGSLASPYLQMHVDTQSSFGVDNLGTLFDLTGHGYLALYIDHESAVYGSGQSSPMIAFGSDSNGADCYMGLDTYIDHSVTGTSGNLNFYILSASSGVPTSKPGWFGGTFNWYLYEASQLIQPLTASNPTTQLFPYIQVGTVCYDTSTNIPKWWNGTSWQTWPLAGITVSGTPSATQVLTATSPTAATWRTPAAAPVGGSVFVYRESEPSPSGNVFASFDAAYNAAVATGVPATIYIDDAYAQCSVGNAYGTNADVSAFDGVNTATITHLHGMTADVVGKTLLVVSANYSQNVGAFPITSYISPTSLQVTNASAIVETANALTWFLVDGASAHYSSSATTYFKITGLVSDLTQQSMIDPSMVGQSIALVNGNGSNNGIYPIAAYCSPSSVWLVIPGGVPNQGTWWGTVYGTSASITTVGGGGIATITGLSNIVSEMVGLNLFLSGAGNGNNNGGYPITAVISSTSVQIQSKNAVAGDTAAFWTVAEGTSADVHNSVALPVITGLTGFTPDKIGNALTMTALSGGNNVGIWPVVGYINATSVLLYNTSPTLPDAGAYYWHVGTNYNLHRITLSATTDRTNNAGLYLYDGATINEGFYRITDSLAFIPTYRYQKASCTLGVGTQSTTYSYSVWIDNYSYSYSNGTPSYLFDATLATNSVFFIVGKNCYLDAALNLGANLSNLYCSLDVWDGSQVGGSFIAGSTGNLYINVNPGCSNLPPQSFSSFGGNVYANYRQLAAALVPFTSNSPYPTPSSASYVQTGTMLYDPYLDAPQWWTGSSWVGAKGASVAVDYDGTTVSTARPVINFIGPAVLVADNSGANSADVTVYITADPEVTHPAFAITLNHLTASLLEVNDITPNTNLFSADRNYTASTVTLTTAVNGVGTGENTNVSAAFAGGTPPTAPSSPTTSAPFTSVRAPFTGTSYGYYVTATLTAIRNSFLTRVATATFFWTQKVYFDVSAIPGSYNGAFILSLAGSLKTTKNGAYTTASPAGPGQYIYFACRSAYGPATFSIGGFNGGLSLVPGGPFAVTNSHGFVENYDLYRSDNSNLGNTTVVVS